MTLLFTCSGQHTHTKPGPDLLYRDQNMELSPLPRPEQETEAGSYNLFSVNISSQKMPQYFVYMNDVCVWYMRVHYISRLRYPSRGSLRIKA